MILLRIIAVQPGTFWWNIRPKTEHHTGGGTRLIPLFPELERPLLDCQEQALDGEVFIIQRYQGKSLNLRTQLERIIQKAGLEVWPKPFQNMRASRESELMKSYDLATACKWLGNSPTVAAKHYAMSTNLDDDFKRAAARPKSGPAGSRKELQQLAKQSRNPLGSRIFAIPRGWMHIFAYQSSAPGRTRTCNLVVRSHALYPIALRALKRTVQSLPANHF